MKDRYVPLIRIFPLGYLGNVLEDLGHCLSGDLASASTLLKIEQQQFKTEALKHPISIATLVKKIRAIQN